MTHHNIFKYMITAKKHTQQLQNHSAMTITMKAALVQFAALQQYMNEV